MLLTFSDKTQVVTAFLSELAFFALHWNQQSWSSRLGIHLLRLPYTNQSQYGCLALWVLRFYKRWSLLNFLPNSLGCLVQHSSLPMKCPEMRDCPALQSQEIDTESEPPLFQSQFCLTFQGKVPESRSKWWYEQQGRGWGSEWVHKQRGLALIKK